jgi:hypothetical protein
MNQNKFSQLGLVTQQELDEALRQNDASQLRAMVLAVALYGADRSKAEDLSRKLSSHSDEEVRGNALLALGHLARLFKVLSSDVKALIEEGLHDSSTYVRGQAWAAAEDVEHYLGWSISR